MNQTIDPRNNGTNGARPALPVAAAQAEPPTAALAIIDPRAAIAPRNMSEVWDYCLAVAKVGLCGVRTPEEALIRMSTGMELGLTPMQSMRGVFIIEGRPGLDAALMVGLCLRRSDICEAFDLVESTDKIATYNIKRRGRPAIRFSFTIEQARLAGLTDKKNWKQPAAMLRARASSQGARVVFPDLTNCLYTADEMDDANVVATVQAERVTYDASPLASAAESLTKQEPAPAATEPARQQPPPQRAPAPQPTQTSPDYEAMASEAVGLIQAAGTTAECDALLTKLAKLAPKGSPNRRALADMLAARREEILSWNPGEREEPATQDPEPDFGGGVQ